MLGTHNKQKYISLADKISILNAEQFGNFLQMYEIIDLFDSFLDVRCCQNVPSFYFQGRASVHKVVGWFFLVFFQAETAALIVQYTHDGQVAVEGDMASKKLDYTSSVEPFKTPDGNRIGRTNRRSKDFRLPAVRYLIP